MIELPIPIWICLDFGGLLFEGIHADTLPLAADNFRLHQPSAGLLIREPPASPFGVGAHVGGIPNPSDGQGVDGRGEVGPVDQDRCTPARNAEVIGDL
ncbi:hypothetical protein ACQPYA_01005 [Micromonospora sp. CA-263727]|uniref:hypothetical protein n=1 Tax=Micromonospora sp. CA-263727 TaxID=3239967 RepID=UPI003D8EF126